MSLAELRRLAEFRHHIRRFLHFSEEAAREKGIEPQQHQLMLAIKGLPPDMRPTLTALSHRLCLRHHSTVELVNRLVDRGAARRKPAADDRREMLVELTAHGEHLLQELSVEHVEELQKSGPALSKALRAVAQSPANRQRSSK